MAGDPGEPGLKGPSGSPGSQGYPGGKGIYGQRGDSGSPGKCSCLKVLLRMQKPLIEHTCSYAFTKNVFDIFGMSMCISVQQI